MTTGVNVYEQAKREAIRKRAKRQGFLLITWPDPQSGDRYALSNGKRVAGFADLDAVADHLHDFRKALSEIVRGWAA